MSDRPLRARRVVQVTLALLVTLVVAEAALRISGHVYLDLAGAALEAPASPGETTILCLGESSTLGLWVPRAESYPRQMEAALRNVYGRKDLRVIVPPHVGYNTSQMANRIDDYLARYHPHLVIVMAGYNNEWSLAESHLGRFLPGHDPETLRLKLLIALDELRLFKVARQAVLRMSGGSPDTAAGDPQRYPPEGAIYSVVRNHPEALIRLWRHDVWTIVRQSRQAGARVLLMTYHINPTYLPAGEVAAMGHEEDVPVVRNDETFHAFVVDGTIGRYLFHDNWHPKANGYAIIAANAYRAVVEGDLLGLGAREANQTAAACPRVRFPPLRRPIAMGAWAAADHLGAGWSWPEGAFRWSDGPHAELLFALDPPEARLLRVRLRAFQEARRPVPRHVAVALNGQTVDLWELTTGASTVRTAPLPARAMQHDNVLSFDLPDAQRPGRDPRRLGIAVESAWLEEFPLLVEGRTLPAGAPETEPFLASGWSWRERGFRWTDGPRASLVFRTAARGARTLVVKAAPFLRPPTVAAQRVNVTLNGRTIGAWNLTDPQPTTLRLLLPAEGLTGQDVVTFETPDAASPLGLGSGEDPRRLGLAVEWMRLEDGATRRAER